MDAIKAAAEAMFAEKTWESLIALVNAVVAAIFGYVAEEEGIEM